jgi:hypothetical protein
MVKVMTKHHKPVPGPEEAKGTAASRSEKLKSFAKAAAGTVAVGLAGTALIASLALAPRLVSAQEKAKPDGKPVPVLVAQATPSASAAGKMIAQVTSSRRLQAGEANGRTLPPELANLPKVSLADIQALEQENGGAYLRGSTDNHKETGSLYLFDFSDNGTMSRFIVVTTICHVSREQCNIEDETNRYLSVGIGTASGKRSLGNFSMDAFSELYTMATGNELKYLRGVFEQGTDRKIGTWLNATIVPVDSPNAPIRSGVPTISMSYFNGKLQLGNEFIE